MAITSWVRAGVISDETLRRGTLEAAGALGHIAVPHGHEVQCWCGNVGCLEAIASGREVVYSRSLPLATQHLRIVGSQTAGRAGVTGASRMVIQHVLSASTVDAMLAGP